MLFCFQRTYHKFCFLSQNIGAFSHKSIAVNLRKVAFSCESIAFLRESLYSLAKHLHFWIKVLKKRKVVFSRKAFAFYPVPKINFVYSYKAFAFFSKSTLFP